MITELRLFGNEQEKVSSLAKHIVDGPIVDRGVYDCEHRAYTYTRGSDRIMWLDTDKEGRWKQCISGLEFASLTIHVSVGLGAETEQESKRVMDDVHYALSRVRCVRDKLTQPLPVVK